MEGSHSVITLPIKRNSFMPSWITSKSLKPPSRLSSMVAKAREWEFLRSDPGELRFVSCSH